MLRLSRAVWFSRLAIAVAALTWFVAMTDGAEKSDKKPVFTQAVDSTFQQRVADDPTAKPPTTESLVLPFPYARREPKIVKAGQRPLSLPDPLDKWIWRHVPKKPAHAEYLEKRSEMLPKKERKKLIRWCLANKLDVCAAYEAICATYKIRKFTDPEYRSYHRYWLDWARKNSNMQVPYSFDLPLKGDWHVVRDTTGHHAIKAGAVFAFDMVIMRNGRSRTGTGRRNSDYFSWGQPIIAQADGMVVSANDEFRDVPPGQRGAFNEANGIVVDYGGGVQGFYGHCQRGSAKVKVGDHVKRGDTLALIGNSGASGAPHLHFTLVDPMGTSIQGRFNYKVTRDGRRWKTVYGKDLVEGTTVRMIETKPKSS